MMKKYLVWSLSLLILLTACGSVSPDKYFSTAVLNMNFVADLGTKQLTTMFKNEPLDLSKKDPLNQPHTTYEAYIQVMTVPFVEKALKNINDLPVTDDTKEMLDASKALFSFALRLYQEEYPKIAMLKDKGASQEELEAAMTEFDEKYLPEFNELYNTLFTLGIDYAKRHDLNVSTY